MRKRFDIDRQSAKTLRTFSGHDEGLGVYGYKLSFQQTCNDLNGDSSGEMVVAESGCANGSECVFRLRIWSRKRSEGFDSPCDVAGRETEILVASLRCRGKQRIVHQAAQMCGAGCRTDSCAIREFFCGERTSIQKLSEHANASWVADGLCNTSEIGFDIHDSMMNELFVRDNCVFAGKNLRQMFVG